MGKQAANNKNKKKAPSKRRKASKANTATTSTVFSLRGWLPWVFFGGLLLFLSYLFYLDRQIVQLFEGRIWSIPAKVYARPLELYVGKALGPGQLDYELNQLAYSEVKQAPTIAGQVQQWDNHYDLVTRGYRFWDSTEDSVRVRIELEQNTVLAITDLVSGEDIPLVRLEPIYIDGVFPEHGEDRVLVSLDDVPDILLKILILTEDRRFFDHHGIDVYAIARAFSANLRAGRTVQGGSTLTQQLVKNLYLTSERSLIRKINEAFMALLLELHYDKRTILQTYLNEVYLGQDRDRAIHGFGLASEYYFRKPLAQLDYAEFALLVAMVKGASYYHPVRHKDRAMARRNAILRNMQRADLVSERQYQQLAKRDIVITPYRKRSKYPAFMDLVTRQLASQYDSDDLKAEGLQIYTSMDLYLQNRAEDVTGTAMRRQFASRPGLEVASVTANHATGDVLAVIGGADPRFPGFNRALDAKRQIGSLVKPVVYLAALSQPQQFTLASVIDDSEITLTNELGKEWTPQNYDREFRGPVLLFDAFMRSLNVPAVKAGLDVGLGAVNQTWKSLGAERELPPLPAITLGAIDASPFDMTGIYQTLAADGFHTPLNSVYAVLDKHGEPLTRNTIDVRREVAADAVRLVNYALSQVTRVGTAKRLAQELDYAVAGKTGTSDDTRDSWFAGFNGELVSVVWMGYDDNRPIGLTGTSAAMKIWSVQMQAMSQAELELAPGGNIAMHSIDRDTGLLGGEGCENNVELPFILDSQPAQQADCVEQSGGGWLQNLFGL